ncbi:MAG TPA: histidine phosphatase family protein [Microlunatus sp.]|nr:histidine phosphatase family protein [Microlunatus sp.]
MSETRTLLLLRHAEAEATRPGFRDRDRRLTERGNEQAANVGETIRTAAWSVDHVLCSPAVRVQETLSGLGLAEDVEVEVVESLFDAGSDSIIELIRALPDDVRCALVVGHAPGVPGVLAELTDPATADPAAWSVVESRFPTATLAALTVDDWSELSDVRLVRAVPH